MLIYMKSRAAMRQLATARKANGFPVKCIDSGPEFKPNNIQRSRYAVSLKG